MKRRHFLSLGQGLVAGGFLAAAGAPQVGGIGNAHAAAGDRDSQELKVADFVRGVKLDRLPGEVIDAVKRVLLDTIGCALGAVGSEPAAIAEHTVRKTFGNGSGATIVGYPTPATVEGAIFVNGVLVRALDLNDTYIGTDPLHPSEVMPTALALVEEARGNGRDLIEAIVAGYEVSARVNDAISYMERGFHPLCAGSYGVPAIAGKVWGMNREAMAHAIGISGARGFTSFVVNSGAISMMKAMGMAATAVDGVFAARLAAQGFTGPADTLGWMAARIKPEKPDLVLDLEPARYRLPRVAFKRFPIQIELQAVAEIGAALSPKVKGSVGRIRAIHVETYPGIIGRVADPEKFEPRTKGTADHSLPVCLALALLDGDVTIAQFDGDRWRAHDVMALVSRTQVSPSEALMARRPKGRGASVEVVFGDGTVIRETVEVAEGDTERPLSRASLEQKFTTFAVPVIGSERTGQIVAMVDGLETVQDIGALTVALRGPGRRNAN